MKSRSDSEAEISTAEQLILISKYKYDIVRTAEDDVLAVPISGPKIAKSLRGTRNNLGDDLARIYREATHKLPSERAINDALRVINSEAGVLDPVQAYLRFAQVGDEIYVDLGDSTGEAIHVTKNGWEIIERPPVLFRRTALTSPLPRPIRGGNLKDLFAIINVPEELQPLASAFLVSAMFDIPHPILAINGEQGSGKSDAAKRLSLVIDPSPAPLQSPPKDIPAWIELAAGAKVISLDNLSHISGPLSDSFCRASTGDGLVKRQHYSDKDLVIYQFKRVLILNGINLTDQRDDLLDRIIPLHLPVISDEKRKLEADLQKAWVELYPSLVGALMDLCSHILRVLPSVELSSLPRMADFAKVLAAYDLVTGEESLNIYLSLINSSATTAIEGDKFLDSLKRHLQGGWTGSAGELLEKINSLEPFVTTQSWPTSAKSVTEKLMRSAPTLRKAGWTVDNLGDKNKGNRTLWRIVPDSN
jgi:hypothetical protein